MSEKKPIKRQKELQPLSRDHHHGLLLCWKIRTAKRKGITEKRVKQYTDWFYKTHLLPHFKEEEEYIFPILGADNKLVKKAMTEHRRLKRLFKEKNEIGKALTLIEEELEGHIRFEERILFKEVEEVASEEDLEKIREIHREVPAEEEYEDTFWK